eukprot:gnl/TRDRNA2_/TRDRNA2_168637_c0_seq1.p1 gnl/TRDRNA2_/TRDRNA2_168637_c0~~gnl/TRDRNA2_/TRDRNA2_168637_c0_seq1.p1  ORF type:complete len:794 (+),score=122.66 gnl/TRDRNA2_/TRDRNA2_168637_c0_seq1:144-2525(+)
MAEAKKGKIDEDKWCNFGSVLQMDMLMSASQLPFEPPAVRYMEEALMGMNGGKYDERASAREEGLLEKLDKLAQILHSTSGVAPRVCCLLFWIAIGVVFGRANENALSAFRYQLARNWFLLGLETTELTSELPEARDWVLGAFPFLCAQVAYRLLCDGFEQDRKNFILQCGPLVEKVTFVTNFEVNGFQLTSDTARRERQRLFLRRVVRTPYVNQREYLKGLERQHMLENQGGGKGQKLKFGELDLDPLDATQLDHVLEGRAASPGRKSRPQSPGSSPAESNRRSPSRRKLKMNDADASPSNADRAGGKSPKSIRGQSSKPNWRDKESIESFQPWDAPSDLCVERYDGLADHGNQLMERHLNDFSTCATSTGDYLIGTLGVHDGDTRSPSPEGSPNVSRPNSPSPRGRSVRSSSDDEMSMISDQPDSPDLSPEGSQPNSPGVQKSRRRWRTIKTATLGSLGATGLRSLKERREIEEMERLAREESIKQKIGSDLLPDEMRERELYTTWVSPTTKRMCESEKDRNLLRKRSAESFYLKMATNPQLGLSRPQSVPTLPGKESAAPDEQRPNTVPAARKTLKKPAADSHNSRKTLGTHFGLKAVGTRSSAARKTLVPGGDPGARGAAARKTLVPPSDSPVTYRRSSIVGGSINLEALMGGHGGHNMRGGNAIDGSLTGKGWLADMQFLSKKDEKGELVNFEPPQNMEGTEIWGRIDSQKNAFMLRTFGEYVKEYNVLTGDKKVRLNATQLGNSESAYVQQMNVLVGGPAVRIDPFSETRARRNIPLTLAPVNSAKH